MAATFTIQDALNYAAFMVSNQPLISNIGVQIAQDASSTIWTAAPWRWTMGTITGSCVNGSQSVTIGSLPGDFLRVEKAKISNSIESREVIPVSWIPTSANLTSFPSFVSVPAAGTTAVFDQNFGPVNLSDSWTLYLWYKKIAPVIGAGNFATAGYLVMDDDWYWVFRHWVLYYAYKYAYDQRAGEAHITVVGDKKQVEYTGELATAKAALETMREAEPQLWRQPQMSVPVLDKG
jgi:hypothetical protein